VELLKAEQSVPIRLRALESLAALGSHAKEATGLLKDLLRSKDKEVRYEAAIALVAIAPEHSADAIPVLRVAAMDDDYWYSSRAGELLRTIPNSRDKESNR
jgi:HEAT repeat protein